MKEYGDMMPTIPTIPAQALYDARDERALISGVELHDLFSNACGDPSPACKTPISVDTLNDLANAAPYFAPFIRDILLRA